MQGLRVALVAFLGAMALTASSHASSPEGAPTPLGRQWSYVLGVGKYDLGQAVATGPRGAVYVAGQGDGAYFVAGFDKDGSFHWLQGGDRGNARGVAGAPDGSVYATGGTTDDGDSDVFLAKYRADGSRVWTVYLGGPFWDSGTDVVVGDNGAVYVAGFAGGPTVDGRHVRGDPDAFLARFTSSGRLLWARLLGTPGFDSARGLAIDHGALYMTGYLGSNDAFVARYATNGARQWVRRLEAGSRDRGPGAVGEDVAVAGGQLYVAGHTDRSPFYGQVGAGDDDAFLARYTTVGRREWVRLVGGPDSDAGTGVGVTSDGRVFIAGIARAPDFDGQPTTGTSDGFLTEFDPDGARITTRLISGKPCPDPGYTYVHDLAVAADDAVYLAGNTLCRFFGGQPLCSKGTDAILVKFAAAPEVQEPPPSRCPPPK